MLRLVAHPGQDCDDCVAWTNHYTAFAMNSDRTLLDAEAQRELVIRGALSAELSTLQQAHTSLQNVHSNLQQNNASLHQTNASLLRELEALRAELSRARDDHVGPRARIRDAESPVRDCARRHSPPRKMRRRDLRPPSPSRSLSSHPSSRASRSASPMVEDRVSAHPGPTLLTRLAANVSPTPPLPPDPPSPAVLSPSAGGDLASRISDAALLGPPALPATAFYKELGFPLLLPVIAHTGRHYVCTDLRPDGSFNYASGLYVYASGYRDAHGPAWTTSLVHRGALFERKAAIDLGIPLPISVARSHIIVGGRNGVLIAPSPVDPHTEDAINELFDSNTPKKRNHLSGYIQRVRHTPPELRDPCHQRALERWIARETVRRQERDTRGDPPPRPKEPSPFANFVVWRKWFVKMKTYPDFNYPGVPLVCQGHQVILIETTRTILSLLPQPLHGAPRGALWDAFLRTIAILLSVPTHYQAALTRLALTVATSRRTQPYSTATYGDETSLGVDGLTNYLADIGITTAEAETWRPWATVYVETELDAHPTGPHALQYSQARQLARDFVDKDRKWVVKVHKKTPGYYNPDHIPHAQQQTAVGDADRTTHTQQQTEVGDTDAGPPSAGDTHMHDELEEALSSFGDEDDENNRMGPA